MAAIDINTVEKVYSGASSCMCGCKGKWSYNTADNLRSYQCVNVRSVKIIANKVANHPDRKDEGNMSYVENPDTGRIIAVYYREAGK